MSINHKSFSLFIAIIFLLSSNLSLLSASAAVNKNAKPSLSQLEALTVNNSKLELFIYLDDLNQDFNSIQTTFPEIRLVSRTKGKNQQYKYSVYEILGDNRTLLSTVSSKKKNNTLTLGNFDNIEQKNIEIEVEDRSGLVNVYKALIQIANTPDSDINTYSNETDISLFTTCFTTENTDDYEKCLELFFRKVTFTSGEDTAVVTNDSGNFVVAMPTSTQQATAGPAGAQGLRGPQGPKGDSGDGYWQLLGNNLINNGLLSDIRANNFVFGDTVIAKDGQNKIAFEKSNGSLRIGSTANGEWSQIGNYSTVIGNNSSATQNGSFSLGHFNKNDSLYSFLIGKHNDVNGGVLAHYTSSKGSLFTTFKKQKSFIFGYGNLDHGGASFTIGANNKNHSRNSIILGNSNSINTEVTKELKNSKDPFFDVINQVYGSRNWLSNKNNSSKRPSESISRNFVSGSSNIVDNPGQAIFGMENSIYGDVKSLTYGSSNLIEGASSSTRDVAAKMYIIGSDNFIAGPSNNSILMGNSNQIFCTYKNGEKKCGTSALLMGIGNTSGNTNYTSSANDIIAIGKFNRVNSRSGMAMGRFTLVNGNRSIAIGSGSYDQPLTVDSDDTLGIGINSEKPAITVKSPDYTQRHTSGDVGIGLVNPQRKLHISDAMRIEPQPHAPYGPSLGDIYVDDSEAVCVYAAGSWTRIAGTGACSEVLRLSPLSPYRAATNHDFSNKKAIFELDSWNLLKLSGFIKIYKDSDDSLIESVDVNSSQVVINSNRIEVTFTEDFIKNEKYYISVDEAIVRDAVTNLKPNPALNGKEYLFFTVSDGFFEANPDNPYNSGFNVAVDTSLSIYFSTTVQKGTGFIRIFKLSDNSLVEAINVTSSAVSNSASVYVFDVALSSNLEYGTQYYIDVDAGIAKTSFNNEVSEAIDGKTQWKFTTRASSD